MKVFYFICRDCGRRQTKFEESSIRPGVCRDCYAKSEPVGAEELREWISRNAH